MAERDAVPASGLPAASLDGNVKSGRGSEGGKGGRKKYLPFLTSVSFLSLIFFLRWPCELVLLALFFYVSFGN